MGSNQKTPQKSIAKLRYFSWGTSVLSLFQLTIFSRQELLDRVWGQDFLGETRTVDVHVGTLRQKLGSAGGYIKTVRGVGYQLEEEDD